MYVLKLNKKGQEAVINLKGFNIKKSNMLDTSQAFEVSSITGSTAYPWVIKVRIKSESTQYNLNSDLVDYFYKVDEIT